MPALLIKDFLQTQGLKLPADEIHVAYLTAQAVIKMGNASVERSILWPSEDGWQLADYVDAEHELLLKQILWLWIRLPSAPSISKAQRFIQRFRKLARCLWFD